MTNREKYIYHCHENVYSKNCIDAKYALFDGDNDEEWR